MTKRQVAMEKFFDDLWRIGCFLLAFEILGLTTGGVWWIVQNAPPPEPLTAIVGATTN